MTVTSASKRKLLVDVASTLGTRLLLLPLSIAAGIIIARALQPVGKGEYATVLVLVDFGIILGGLGLSKASTYLIASGRSQDARMTSLALAGLTGVIVAGSLAVVADLWISRILPGVSTLTLLVAAPLALVSMFRLTGEGFLRGEQRNQAINATALIFGATALMGLVVVAALGATTPQAAIGVRLTAAVAAAGIVLVFAARRVSVRRWGRVRRSAARTLLGFGVPYAAISLAQNLNYDLDILLAQALLASGDVGVYSVGVSTAELLWYVPTSIAFVLLPRVAAATVDPSHETAAILRWTLALTASTALVLGILAGPLIGFAYGAAYAGAAGPLRILLAGVVANTAYQILSGYMLGRGAMRGVVIVTLAGVAINLALNLVLMPVFGIGGAAVASLISYSVTAVGMVVLFCRRTGTPVVTALVLTRDDVVKMLRRFSLTVPFPAASHLEATSHD